MAVSVEIIDFSRPVSNSKNLYISGIVTNELNEAQITATLYEACSPFGLLYEVQVFPGMRVTSKPGQDCASYYAFVKFFSYQAAQRAKLKLSKTLVIGSQLCKISFAVRNKETEVGQTLYVSRCQELANFYLGFNGWTSSILRLEKDDTSSEPQPHRVRFFCVIELRFPAQGLSTRGLGAWEERFSVNDPGSKLTATLKARKRSQQRALESAFSRVLLVVLGEGGQGRWKVRVEVDTTKPDHLTQQQHDAMAQEQVLQVTELCEEPELEDSDYPNNHDVPPGLDHVSPGLDHVPPGLDHVSPGLDHVPPGLDHANLHILQELGDGMT